MKKLLLVLLLCLLATPAGATVNETVARNDYTGNGTTTAFPYTFRIIVKEALQVYLGTTLQVLDVAYNVTGVGNSAGTVVFLTPPPANAHITILRKQAKQQTSVYQPNEAFPAKRIETDYDKNMMADQQQEEEIGRALKFYPYSLNKDVWVEDPINGKCLQWSTAAGNFIVTSGNCAGGGGGGGGGGNVSGSGIKGQNSFWLTTSDIGATNRETYVGAYGTTRAAIQEAIDATGSGGVIHFECFTYTLDGTPLTITKPLTLLGCMNVGTGGTVLNVPNVGSATGIAITSTSGVNLLDFSITGANAGTGITVSNVNTVKFTRLTFTTLATGISANAMLTSVIDSCYFQSWTTAAIALTNTVNTDQGDNTIVNSFFGGLDSGTVPAAIDWRSGSGLRVINNKFLGDAITTQISVDWTGLTFTGDTHSSATVDGILPSTAGLVAGMAVYGSGVPAATTILSVDTANQITLSAATISSLTGTDLRAASTAAGDIQIGPANSIERGKTVTGYGVRIRNRANGINGVSVIGNQFTTAGYRFPISLEGGFTSPAFGLSNVQISDNVIQDAQTGPVVLVTVSNVLNFNVTNNTFNGLNTATCVAIDADSGAGLVSNNAISGCTTPPITDASGNQISIFDDSRGSFLATGGGDAIWTLGGDFHIELQGSGDFAVNTLFRWTPSVFNFVAYDGGDSSSFGDVRATGVISSATTTLDGSGGAITFSDILASTGVTLQNSVSKVLVAGVEGATIEDTTLRSVVFSSDNTTLTGAVTSSVLSSSGVAITGGSSRSMALGNVDGIIDNSSNVALIGGHDGTIQTASSAVLFDLVGGYTLSTNAAFVANATVLRFPAQASAGTNCLQIDASGNVSNTGTSCGGTGVAVPLNEIAVGTGPGLTGFANLTWNDTDQMLNVGGNTIGAGTTNSAVIGNGSNVTTAASNHVFIFGNNNKGSVSGVDIIAGNFNDLSLSAGSGGAFGDNNSATVLAIGGCNSFGSTNVCDAPTADNFGQGNTASGAGGAENHGQNNITSGADAYSFGFANTNSGDNCVVVGQTISCTHNGATVVGANTNSVAVNSVSLGVSPTPELTVTAGVTSVATTNFGASANIKVFEEELTILAAANTDTAFQFPAGSTSLGCTVRVTTVIPTAVTFDTGVAGATTRYATGTSTALNSTGGTAVFAPYAMATSVRITPNTTPGTATGTVRVTCPYIDVTPATS